MLRSLIAISFVLSTAPAFAMDRFAQMEVQRQMAQFQRERTNFAAMTAEQTRRTNERRDTNEDRPLRGAKMLAGGPPKIVKIQKPIRFQPIKFKRKTQVGGIVGHIGYGNSSGSNFGRIFTNGPSASFNFHGLSEGAKPFSFSR
jgi:hypothetical protein